MGNINGKYMEIMGYEWNLNTNGDIIPSRENKTPPKNKGLIWFNRFFTHIWNDLGDFSNTMLFDTLAFKL